MKFIDEVKVYVSSGKGGDGFVGWRREKYVPRGGPNGGIGGNGGAVIFVADPNHHTLLDLSYNPIIEAEAGQPGGPNNLHGRNGQDKLCTVPTGTQVCYEDQLVADLSVGGCRWVAARGGHGGKGNSFFKSSANQAPDYAQKGQPGESFKFRLVLKSVADVGVIGFPNVGKSTLVANVSKAKPLVADYPFTTLKPTLGVVELDRERRFVVADIPGLIRNAHHGKGLGVRFLKHIERTSLLAHMVDASNCFNEDSLNNPYPDDVDDEVLERGVLEQFDAIERELSEFPGSLENLPRIVVFSKADLPLTNRAFTLTRKKFERRGFKVCKISAATGKGVKELLEQLYQSLREC